MIDVRKEWCFTLDMKKHYSSDEVRVELGKRLQGRTQAEVCREIGLKPQNLSVMVAGGPIYGKVLDWLGYRKVEDLYERSGEA